MALIVLAGAFSLAGLAAPTAAQASTMAVDQCNVHVPGTAGATTAMKCTVTVVNTVGGTSTYSRTTVTRQCTLGPCSSPNGTFVTDSVSLVTVIRQCNGSDNDAKHALSCYVNVINNIGRSTPDAQPLTTPTVNQCVGSGGSSLSCNASVITRIIDIAPVAVPKATSTRTATATPTTTAPTTTAPTTTAAATPSESAPATTTAATAGALSDGASGGTDHAGLFMLLAGLVLLGALGTLLYRRFAPSDLFARFAAKNRDVKPAGKDVRPARKH